MSLRRRLMLYPAIAVASAVALASVVIYVSVHGALRASLDDRLRTLAAKVATEPGRRTGTSPGERLDLQSRRTFLLLLPSSPLGEHAGYAQLVSADGTIQQPARQRATHVRLAAGPRVRAVAQGTSSPFFYESVLGRTPVRVYVSRFTAGQALQAAVSLEDLRSTSTRLVWVLALVAIGGAAFAAIAGRVFGRAALRSIRRLASEVRYVETTQDLSRRVPALGRDELGSLGRSFNSMLQALAESRSAQRQLVADASHELRTPLTTVRANVELLARESHLTSDERLQLRQDLAGELEELTDLVGDLVELARERLPETHLERFDLAVLTAEAVERARSRFPDVRFELDLAPTWLRADRSRVRRAVANLLDNAGKWSPASGTVHVALVEGQLVVRDEGPGIPADASPRVFDRFYRAPEARGLPGSGLGLAIVKQVADMHGGRAWVAGAAGRGAEVHLQLPPVPHAGVPG